MDLGIENRIALVCGASRGIGRACAEALAREGVYTVLVARTETDLCKVMNEITKEGGKAEYFVADLSQIELIEGLAEKVQSVYGRIDILINNTGGPPSGENLSFSPTEWENAFRQTFMSAQELTKQLIIPMEERKWGRVINLTSITVKQPVKGLILSNSIRMAVIGWAKTLSQQFAPAGITINNIATGFTYTGRVKALAKKRAESEGKKTEQVIDEMISSIPMGRMAEPGEIAAVVSFLAGETAAYITGTTIPVDGGVLSGF
jgi:3-oxoacyl-[acyl-carrier protein] reductase